MISQDYKLLCTKYKQVELNQYPDWWHNSLQHKGYYSLTKSALIIVWEHPDISLRQFFLCTGCSWCHITVSLKTFIPLEHVLTASTQATLTIISHWKQLLAGLLFGGSMLCHFSILLPITGGHHEIKVKPTQMTLPNVSAWPVKLLLYNSNNYRFLILPAVYKLSLID